MNQAGIIFAAVVTAVVLDIVFLYVWRRGTDQNDNIPRIKFLGAYSPLLTWLRFRKLPRVRIAFPRFHYHPSLRQIGFILVILLAVISQWILLKTPDKPGWALMGYAVAALLFVWISRQTPIEEQKLSYPAVSLQTTKKRTYIVASLMAASVVASLFTILSVNQGKSGPMDYVLVASWWLSIILYISAVLVLTNWHWPNRAALSAWWRDNWKETAGLLCLVLVALAARVIDLTWLPYAMGNDEGQVGLAALKILNGETTNLFKTGWAAQPVWSFVPNAIAISLMGNSLIAVRLVSAIEGTLAVVCLYLLAREAFGREVAFLAAIGLTGIAWHIHFSRLGFHNVIDSLTATAALWLAYRALRHGRLTDYLLAGLMTGLVVYTYVGSRLVIILVLGMLAFSWLGRAIRLRTHVMPLLVFTGATVIVAGPVLSYFYQHPDLFMARMNNASLLANGNLEKLVSGSGQSIPAALVTQFSKSALVYVAGAAYGDYFNSPRPYLPAFAAVFLVLGLAYATWRAREPRYATVVFWLWMVILLGSTLTFSPPTHQRMIMAAPAITLLVAIGLWQTARLAHQLGIVSRNTGLLICLVIMALVCVQGISHYFGEFRLGHYYENPSEEFSHEVSLAVKELGPDYRLVVIGEPILTTRGHANFGYIAAGIDQMDFNTVTPESLLTLPLDKGILFAAIPMRVNDLKKVAHWLPGGKWMDVPRRYQPDKTLYHAYRLSPETAADVLAIHTASIDPYEDVVFSPNGKFSAKLRVNWADLSEKPMIEIWDNTGSLLWEVEYQFPEVSNRSMMAIYGWSPDSSKVYFYYPYWYEAWYTIFKGSYLQSIDPETGEVNDVIAGCCIDFDFSQGTQKIAYTSEDKVGILDLATGMNKSVAILPHKFDQSGRIFLSPSGKRVIFHTLNGFVGKPIYLDTTTMEQKTIMEDYLIMEYEFDGWTQDENPRFRKGDEIFTIDLDTLERTVVGTVTPQP